MIPLAFPFQIRLQTENGKVFEQDRRPPRFCPTHHPWLFSRAPLRPARTPDSPLSRTWTPAHPDPSVSLLQLGPDRRARRSMPGSATLLDHPARRGPGSSLPTHVPARRAAPFKLGFTPRTHPHFIRTSCAFSIMALLALQLRRGTSSEDHRWVSGASTAR